MYSALRRSVLQANLDLAKSGLVVLTWGNVSQIDRAQNAVAIKPSGLPYASMELDDIVVVNPLGEILAGGRKPSSDLPTHLALYQAFPEIGGVAHTHSTYATAWAQAGCDLPAEGTTHADHFYGPVPCARPLTAAEISGDYERNTGAVLIEALRARRQSPLEMPAVLARAHGPFVWGECAAAAVENAIALEEVAKIATLARQIAPASALPQVLLDRHFLRKHGADAYYGQIVPRRNSGEAPGDASKQKEGRTSTKK